MRRWIAFVAVLYPRSWRDEFGDEFGALLDDVKPSWRVFRNVLGGAISMQITEGTNWLKVVAATAVLCALVAGGLSYRVAPNYVSSAVISLTPQADPVRPMSPEVLHQRAAAHLVEMETGILSRWSLATTINDPRLQLYQEERRRMPLEDVIEKMRSDIHIQAVPATDDGMAPIVFSISFSYPDQVKAQAVVRALAGKFTEENINENRVRTAAYQGFWGDMAQFAHTKPAPPAPVGEIVGVLNMASLPMDSVGPNRLVFLARGLGVGLVLGLLVAIGLRKPRGVWQLVGFALAGFAIACALSYLIPNRFKSNATMTLAPAMLTEDPLAALPAATPAVEFLRQTEPEILSFETLSRIILDRRLNLYASELASKPIEEVVRNMVANDLRITPLEPGLGATGAVSAFKISFSYYDRYKTQMTVSALMNAFEEQRQRQAMAKGPQMSVALHAITQRKGGEVLEVIDPASLPVSPVAPNRLMISVAGMVVGLLIGGIRIWRRPRGLVLQAA